MGGTPSQVWEGTPSQVYVGGTPSNVWVGGTPSQVWVGVTHVRSEWWEVPHLRFRWWGGVWVPREPSTRSGWGWGTLSQVWLVEGTWGTPTSSGWWGVSHPRSRWWGVPHLRFGWWGYPITGLDGVGGTQCTLQPGLDGGGTPSQVWMVGGTQGTPPPMRQSSIAITCYVAGSVPLAFTQEDILVFLSFEFVLFCFSKFPPQYFVPGTWSPYSNDNPFGLLFILLQGSVSGPFHSLYFLFICVI